MTDPPDERPPRTSSHDRVRSVAVAPLALWLVIQLAVLALSAARVPMWYGAPHPLERVAAAQMVVAQVVASALLFPWLMRDLATGACAILVAAPFIQLAALLTDVEPTRALRGWAYVALWMTALLIWTRALHRSMRAQLYGIAVAGVAVIGVPLLRYFRMEFADIDARMRWLDPTTGAIAQLRPDAVDVSAWLLVAGVVVGGALAWLASHTAAGNRQVIHNSDAPHCA